MLVKEFNECKEKWDEGELLQLDPEVVIKDHKDMFRRSAQLELQFKNIKVPKPMEVATKIKGALEGYRKYLPVISSLCTEGLKQRHWDDIEKIIGASKENIRTLNTLKNIDLERVTSKLEDIADVATKEYGNERMLAQMKEAWEPMEFACKEWKGTFILDGEAVELIQALLDDHIIKAQTMKGSPFAKVFAAEIGQWESSLLRI